MGRKSIIIIDSKCHAGSSWKKALGKNYEIAAIRDFYIIEKLCRGGFVSLIIINTHLQKEFDLNIFRKLKQTFPLLPIIVLISRRCLWDNNELAKSGIDHAVKKPFLIETLEEEIEETLCEQVSF